MLSKSSGFHRLSQEPRASYTRAFGASHSLCVEHVHAFLSHILEPLPVSLTALSEAAIPLILDLLCYSNGALFSPDVSPLSSFDMEYIFFLVHLSSFKRKILKAEVLGICFTFCKYYLEQYLSYNRY